MIGGEANQPEGVAVRRSLCEPIPAIFDAARDLIRAVESHSEGDFASAGRFLERANSREVWDYTDKAWGKNAAKRYGFINVPSAPPYFAVPDRPKPRMPDGATRRAVLQRDSYHCRFCGIPVIDPALRRMFSVLYPKSVPWGSTNASQHAAFQCMWLQFDHVLPNSRGGDSSLANIVVACAPCNFGRMEATLDEARVSNPFCNELPIAWDQHAQWDGLERFRSLS